MINFNLLKLKVHARYSFVGIQKQDDELYFYLPRGFDDRLSEIDTFVGKRDLFFLLYKILGTFKQICIEKGYIDNIGKFGTQDRDGIINSQRGSEIQDDEEESENIFYSKLDLITHFLEAYDEPKILALAYRLGRSNKFDVSQIHRYLHQAVYLPNHAAYVDEMPLPRRVMQFESTDIVTMYCYLFCEIKQQLGEAVNAEITALAERFRQHHFGNQDSLFDEQSYEQALDILKDALEIIDHNTPIKDVDYWQYYEIIKLFLYGNWHQAENGEIWGIKNFHSVWESMCLTYLVQRTDPSLLLYLDDCYLSSRTVERAKSSAKLIDLSKAFNINGYSLNPDAIVLSLITHKIKGEKTYKMSAHGWKDYNDDGTYYKTGIYRFDTTLHVKVGYIGQGCDHTMEKIKEFYPQNKFGDVIINAPLPNEFYSFWKISFPLNLESLNQMSYFNHLFFLALKRQITDWDRFNKEILQPLGIFSGNFYNDPRFLVFNLSLFKDIDIKWTRKHFNDFIQQFLNQDECFFVTIIDIKYLEAKYFHNPNKIEEIKSRSVRKQFVYEHLLQKTLEKRKDQYTNLKIKDNQDSKLNIRSSFWLPSYRPDDSNLLQDDSTFMDGYIKLKNVNFKLLAETYLA